MKACSVRALPEGGKMTQIEIYTSPLCGYCHAAKRLLTQKGAAYTEIDVSRDPALREAMVQRAGGRRSVPQIFIEGRHIGGCDDLYALDGRGGLDPLLAG
jgi:glutaredoxin 3